MRLPAMFVDVVRSLFSKPATELYPAMPAAEPERLRGKLTWSMAQCTGCALCVKDCPADAIELIMVDKANKRFRLNYDVGRCTFCGQCVQSCRFDCLELSNRVWSMPATNTAVFRISYGETADVVPNVAEGAETTSTDE